jgi:hypothetical protein
MATLIPDSDIFFTSFEPKVQNRFIMYMNGVPSYIIKKVNRPSIEFGDVDIHHINMVRKLKGKANWGDFSMTLYDPIVPSGAQAVMEWIRISHESLTGRDGYADFYKKDLQFEVLGPVGDIVEEWVLKGAYIKSAQFGDLDWAVDTQVEINVTLRVDNVYLNF